MNEKALEIKINRVLDHLQQIEKTISEIYSRAEKTDKHLHELSVEIGKIQKDVEYINKEKDDINKGFDSIHHQLRGKVDLSLIDEKIKNSEIKIKAFIYKSIAGLAGSIVLNYILDRIF